MIHIIFELFVSSARIWAYTSETPGACAVAGSAARIKHERKNAQSLATFPPTRSLLFLFRVRSRSSIYLSRLAQAIGAQKCMENYFRMYFFTSMVYSAP